MLSALFVLSLSIGIALYALRHSVTYFYAPTLILEKSPTSERQVRLGGIVVDGSVSISSQGTHSFTLTDNQESIDVEYNGPLPGLFREGQGIIVEGHYYAEQKKFKAETVLAKHDENYMPPEISKTPDISPLSCSWLYRGYR